MGLEFREVGQQRTRLLRRLRIELSAEEYAGGATPATECQDRGEIGVGGYEDSIIHVSAEENLGIFCRTQPKFASVYRIMTVAGEQDGQLRRYALIKQKPHVPVSGNSRSRTASAA